MMLRIEPGFEGLLSGIAKCLREGKTPGGFITGSDCPLLTACEYVQLENQIVSKFSDFFTRRISKNAASEIMNIIWQAWLSETPGIDMRIFSFLKLAGISSRDPSADIDLPAVSPIIKAARKSTSMAHSYLGILRFRLISSNAKQLYLADIEPDCNILPLITEHFAIRFADQDFVIRDLKRQMALMHEANGKCSLHYLIDIQDSQLPDLQIHDLGDEPRMWRDYLKCLTIPERINNDLQKSNLPLKYRKHMSESD